MSPTASLVQGAEQHPTGHLEGLFQGCSTVCGVDPPDPCHPGCRAITPTHPVLLLGVCVPLHPSSTPAMGMTSPTPGPNPAPPPLPISPPQCLGWLPPPRSVPPHTAPAASPSPLGSGGAQWGCGVTSPSARAAGSAAAPLPPGASGARPPPAPAPTAPWPSAAAPRSWGTGRWAPRRPPPGPG